MTFYYDVYPDDAHPKGYVELPLLDVRLFYRGNYDDVRCLVDSGADECLFNSSIAENLGIELEEGEPRTYYPVGGEPFKGFIHRIELQILGFDERIEIEAGFTDSTNLSLLGQEGFFDNYEVIFRGYEKRFEINSVF
jgi:hypothetical protein